MASGSKRDSTVLTIAALRDNQTQVIKTYAWRDQPHHQAIDTIARLAEHWRIAHLVADATGIGEPIAALLARRLGRIVTPFKFTAPSKSELAYNLLASANRGQLRIHQGADPELWNQLSLARTQVRPNRTMNFFVEPREGHDDFLMSLALVDFAARAIPPTRIARGA